jgi:hypothetical protein
VREPVIRAMDDLVDRERRRRPPQMLRVVLVKLQRYALQPFFQHCSRSRVERWKCSNDAGLALRNHKVRI